jgi:hypothetical protein
MIVRVHNEADEKLIKKLFKVNPLDWARYPDGRLVFIADNGAKFSYTAEDLKAFSSSAAKSSETFAGAKVGETRASTASSPNAKSSKSSVEAEDEKPVIYPQVPE